MKEINSTGKSSTALYNSKLKVLDIIVPTLSKACIDHITSYTNNSQLSTLKISMQEANLFDQVEDCGFGTILKLARLMTESALRTGFSKANENNNTIGVSRITNFTLF